MSSMITPNPKEQSTLNAFLSKELGVEVTNSAFISRNPYCRIYQAIVYEEKAIIKLYEPGRDQLALAETQAVQRYHLFAKRDKRFHDCRVLHYNIDRCFAASFVPGKSLAHWVYDCKRDAAQIPKTIEAVRLAASWLCSLAEETKCLLKPDPFLIDYLLYTSGKLQKSRFVGSLFPHAIDEANQLIQDYLNSEAFTTAIHGDFVFRNIHFDGERVGIIDFANSLDRSHILNDAYNWSFALKNMVLPKEIKLALSNAFFEGLGRVELDDAVHAFYYEYHRRRWLMLNLLSRNPLRWMRGLVALKSFCRPWSPERSLK